MEQALILGLQFKGARHQTTASSQDPMARLESSSCPRLPPGWTGHGAVGFGQHANHHQPRQPSQLETVLDTFCVSSV